MSNTAKPLAVVTGASSGIGFELAKLCAENGFDLVLAADETKLEEAADELLASGASVDAVVTDLATIEGVDQLIALVGDRPVGALLANAGQGLGHGFLDQDFGRVRQVVDTNITGTLYLIQNIARTMVGRGNGRILITGSVAGFLPGTYQAVYNGTKAFLDSFSVALRHELKETGVTVTCLEPGPIDTNFFERADMLDTQVGQDDKKEDPAATAKNGFEAMMKGEAEVVSGLKNKFQVAMSRITPDGVLAEMHGKMAKPGSAKS